VNVSDLSEFLVLNGEPHGLFNVNQACEYLSIKRTKLYELMDAGELRYLKIGDRRLISREQLDDFVRRQEVRFEKSDGSDILAR
jgi:excisionase family DNA binding protein